MLVERLPLLELDCFIYKYKSLQAGQLPRQHLSFLQNLLNFIITKYLKQEVDNDLSVIVDERSPCGLPANDFTNPIGEVPYGILSRSCFYHPNLITAVPL